MLAPLSTYRAASSHSASSRGSIPLGPCSTGQVMSIVAASNTSWETWRSFSSSWFRRIGWSITRMCACSGDSDSRLTSAPTPAWRLITTDSRIGSIGGLVTCANSCLKYENSGGWRSESTASAASLPMLATGSSPLAAIGAITIRKSSCE